MKRQIILTLAMSAMLLTATAQENNRGERRGQGMKSEKPEMTAEQRAERAGRHIAGELMLDDASSSKFQSIYKDYQLELSEVNQKYMPEHGKKVEGEQAKGERKHRSDKEIEDGIKNRFAHQRALLDIEEKYYGKFRSVLNARQLEKVYRMSDKGGKGFGGKGGRGGFGHGGKKGQGFGKKGQGLGMRGNGGHGFSGPRGGHGFGPQRGVQGPSGQDGQSVTDTSK